MYLYGGYARERGLSVFLLVSLLLHVAFFVLYPEWKGSSIPSHMPGDGAIELTLRASPEADQVIPNPVQPRLPDVPTPQLQPEQRRVEVIPDTVPVRPQPQPDARPAVAAVPTPTLPVPSEQTATPVAVPIPNPQPQAQPQVQHPVAVPVAVQTPTPVAAVPTAQQQPVAVPAVASAQLPRPQAPVVSERGAVPVAVDQVPTASSPQVVAVPADSGPVAVGAVPTAATPTAVPLPPTSGSMLRLPGGRFLPKNVEDTLANTVTIKVILEIGPDGSVTSATIDPATRSAIEAANDYAVQAALNWVDAQVYEDGQPYIAEFTATFDPTARGTGGVTFATDETARIRVPNR